MLCRRVVSVLCVNNRALVCCVDISCLSCVHVCWSRRVYVSVLCLFNKALVCCVNNKALVCCV